MQKSEWQKSDWWNTEISDISPGVIRYHGYPVEQLIAAPGLSIGSMIWLMTRGELPSRRQADLLERAMIAAVDHGPQAPSIAIARMAMTCGVDINNAMASAINVLGDVHGGAGQQLMELLLEITADDRPVTEVVAEKLQEFREQKEHIPGFGHRFHPQDPRRDPLIRLLEQAQEAGEIEGSALEATLEIERQINAGRTRPIPMNIDGATAVIYAELGFSPMLGRGLFVLSRSIGALAHANEEFQSQMRNKGPENRTVLPNYQGATPRDVP
ncbi:citryl-CoA lyase [Corynebacterium sp. A21]|uniref:citryl-CoA lyase n=1 Tax=Corynebacterium sp. A21 TaxID=3457318 RepID=UPI003FCFC7CB